MAYTAPTTDFLTTTLSGGITGVATSATIGTGLNLPATNGILQIDYDSSTAVGSDNGPETISYATYTSGTGALTGLIRGLANTTNGSPGVGVAHLNSAHVQSAMSTAYLAQSPQYDTWNSAGTLTYGSVDGPTSVATITGDSTSAIYPGVRVKANQTQAIQNYWTFDTNSADSKGGATMADIGTPTYTAGKFSNALTLNGSNQALSITDAATLKPTDNFSIGCWFKTSSAGALKGIFQSQSANTNTAGIYFSIDANNHLYMMTEQNTSSTSYTPITGTTTVTDGNWHYAVWTFRNNYGQIYLDGKLEASGYQATPAYAATNYVRIGCLNNTGSNIVWFNGQIDDLFIAAYALDEQTIAAKYAAATAQGTGDLTLTKYFLCTASSYVNPTTTLTLYGGTDHMLSNAAITSAYYSTQKAPLGFPLKQDKWTVWYSDPVGAASGGTTLGTWYQIYSLSMPIGQWVAKYAIGCYSTVTAASGFLSVSSTLSSVTAAQTDNELSAVAYLNQSKSINQTLMGEKAINTSAKKTWYFNIMSGTGSSAISNLGTLGNGTTVGPSACYIKFASTLL